MPFVATRVARSGIRSARRRRGIAAPWRRCSRTARSDQDAEALDRLSDEPRDKAKAENAALIAARVLREVLLVSSLSVTPGRERSRWIHAQSGSGRAFSVMDAPYSIPASSSSPSASTALHAVRPASLARASTPPTAPGLVPALCAMVRCARPSTHFCRLPHGVAPSPSSLLVESGGEGRPRRGAPASPTERMILLAADGVGDHDAAIPVITVAIPVFTMAIPVITMARSASSRCARCVRRG